jgi:hypothetical protein
LQEQAVGLAGLTLQLESIASDIHPVSNRIALVRGMGLLQKIRDILKHFVR